MGYDPGLAVECAIADIAILEDKAVVIQQAFTVHRCSDALAIHALVTEGTDVVIVAQRVKVFPVALTGFGLAEVFGADVIVATINGNGNADTGLTGTVFSTQVTIVALDVIKSDKLADRIVTNILGARILVIAKTTITLTDNPSGATLEALAKGLAVGPALAVSADIARLTLPAVARGLVRCRAALDRLAPDIAIWCAEVLVTTKEALFALAAVALVLGSK